MENAFKRVEDIINQFCLLQEDHLKAFDTQILPDIGKQSEERKDLMAGLMQTAKAFLMISETRHDAQKEFMVTRLNNGIQNLLEQNKVLEKKIKVLREGIKNNMKNVSKGRKVIGSYRSGDAASKAPKVISITN